ncbi:MAG TPA: GNAT family N-acetyltransferase [Terriglobales bacterium]|nr:GNAT family N-acetyltransferase [Terriglobales bacterium]
MQASRPASDCLIRRATFSDAQAVLRCLHAAFEPYRSQYTEGAFRDTVLDPVTVHKRLARMSLFVAIAPDGKIVGTIGCEVQPGGSDGHLRGMAVLPQCQGGRAAAQLLDRAEEELRDGGCSRVTLDTTEPLQRAIRFYEKHGYARTGHVADFYGMPLHEFAKNLRSGSRANL